MTRICWMGLALLAACEAPRSAPPEVAERAPDPYVAVRAGPSGPVLEAPARLLLPGQAMAQIASLAAGRVRGVFVEAGDRVKAGDPIVEVASPVVAEAAATWRSLTDELEVGQQRLERLTTLTEERIASRDELQRRKEALIGLSGRRRGVTAMLLSHGLAPEGFDRVHRTGAFLLRSPIEGVVTELAARLGQSVGPADAPLAHIAGAGRPRIEAKLEAPPGVDLSYVFHSSDGVRFDVVGDALAAIADEHTGAWTAWFNTAEDAVIMGERVGELQGMAQGDDVFTVPASALGSAKSSPFVVRRTKDGEPDRVPVRVLHLDDRVAIIRGPLFVDDRVAEDPAAIDDDV